MEEQKNYEEQIRGRKKTENIYEDFDRVKKKKKKSPLKRTMLSVEKTR